MGGSPRPGGDARGNLIKKYSEGSRIEKRPDEWLTAEIRG